MSSQSTTAAQFVFDDLTAIGEAQTAIDESRRQSMTPYCRDIVANPDKYPEDRATSEYREALSESIFNSVITQRVRSLIGYDKQQTQYAGTDGQPITASSINQINVSSELLPPGLTGETKQSFVNEIAKVLSSRLSNLVAIRASRFPGLATADPELVSSTFEDVVTDTLHKPLQDTVRDPVLEKLQESHAHAKEQWNQLVAADDPNGLWITEALYKKACPQNWDILDPGEGFDPSGCQPVCSSPSVELKFTVSDLSQLSQECEEQATASQIAADTRSSKYPWRPMSPVHHKDPRSPQQIEETKARVLEERASRKANQRSDISNLLGSSSHQQGSEVDLFDVLYKPDPPFGEPLNPGLEPSSIRTRKVAVFDQPLTVTLWESKHGEDVDGGYQALYPTTSQIDDLLSR